MNTAQTALSRLVLVFAVSAVATVAVAAGPSPLTLWYTKPAANWNEALPLGNGRMGAMVFGGVKGEHLQLNECTLVSGYPGYRTLPLDARKDFAEITGCIARRDFAEADRLVTARWLGGSWACYQPLGDLEIEMAHAATATDYRRELDIGRAVCRVTYTCDGTRFTREIFASHPAEAIVLRLTADRPGQVTFKARLTSPHTTAKTTAQAHELAMHGQLPGFVLRRKLDWVEKKGDTWKYPAVWDKDGKRKPGAGPVVYDGRGMFFDARLGIEAAGGKVSADEDAIAVTGADEVVLRLTAASSYNGFDKDPVREGVDAAQKAADQLAAAAKKKYAESLDEHTRDYRGLFDRVTLTLGDPASPAPDALSTDARLKRLKEGQADPGLETLYFQFGRYLMIAGSRPGGQPLNLQGIWNRDIIPPWACQYTININTEMNYWPAETCNLSECTEPLVRMIRELAVDGRRVAREMYGRRGWVAHHNTTLWRDAQPVDNAATAAYWPNGAGWLTMHLFEHYQFTGDREFLAREAYPLMKDACLFYLDWLVDNGHGKLVTPVSTSPENTFRYKDASGKEQRSSVSAGTTMDMAIIRQLFGNTLRAAETLDVEPEFRASLKGALGKLLPYQIGSNGQLLEWQEEFAENDPHHRHVSHLLGLHPGDQITAATPDLLAAARRSLELRGDGGTGWSKAWKINFWARLGDGDHAHLMLTQLLAQSTCASLLDLCPPFQIDGNFGGTAGVAEMLLQSHTGEVALLPALPAAWRSGTVKGLCARGGVRVDITWKDGRVTDYHLAAKQPQDVKIRVNGQAKTVHAECSSSPSPSGRGPG